MMAKAIALVAGLALLIGEPQAAPSPRVQKTTSYALITQALAAGRIDRETAYKYRVFAAFGDARLPEQYRGDDSGMIEPPRSVHDAGSLLSTFSAATQSELAPFFKTPAEPGSWVELQVQPREPDDAVDAGGPDTPDTPPTRYAIEWYTVLAAGGNVKIWAQKRFAGDSAKADAIASEMTNRIWRTLVPLLGPPMSDQGMPHSSGGPELDIFLVRSNHGVSFGGLAEWADPASCKATAHYLLANSLKPLGSATQPGLLHTIVHEFTHAINAAKPLKGPCNDYQWMNEATASWAEHKVYPRAQSEHEYARGFMNEVDLPLDASTDGDTNWHAYYSYLFPLYLQINGNEQVIPEIWRNFSALAQRPAINAGLMSFGLRLNEVFPKFAVRNLNQASVDEYTQRDQLPATPTINDTWDVSIASGAADWEKAIPQGMRYLATKYAHFKFDNTVRMVSFENTLVPIDYAGVWIVEYINGWKDPVDLSKTQHKAWCRDRLREDLDELLIVFTNNEWRDTSKVVDPGKYPPVLTAYPSDCGTGWTGTSTLVNTITSTDPDVTIVETVRMNVRFEPDSSLNEKGKPPEYFKSVQGDINWRVQVSGKCSGSAQGHLAIKKRDDDHAAELRIWKGEDDKTHYSAFSSIWPGDIPWYQLTCPGSSEQPRMTLFAASGWFATDGDKDLLPPDRKSFSGSFISQPSPANKVHHSYSFRCTMLKC